jgi:hypothetical protein
VKLVKLKRQAGDGSAEVVATVGPMQDAEADAYASRLQRLAEQHPDPRMSVGTTSVESASGQTAEPPTDPAGLLLAVLSGHGGTRDGEHDLPEPDPRG